MDIIIREILLIQAYFAISLISVTFAIYALCVGYLRKEKLEIDREQEDSLKLGNEKISDLTKKRQGMTGNKLKEMDIEIKKTKKKLKKLKNQYTPLTAKGAVRNPILYLFASLFFSIFTIFVIDITTSEVIFFLMIISWLLMGVAILNIYGTITRVEDAALRTEYNAGFEVYYTNLEKIDEIRLGTKKKITIRVSSHLDIENFQLCVFVPPELEVKSHNFDEFFKKLSKDYDHAGYALCRASIPFFKKNKPIGFGLELFSDKAGDHKLLISITGKHIKSYSCKLILNVKE